MQEKLAPKEPLNEMPVATTQTGTKIPAWLDRSKPKFINEIRQFWTTWKPFRKFTPEDLILQMGTKPEALDAMAGLFSGWGWSLGRPVPEFAVLASKNFWRHLFGNDFSPMESIHDSGLMIRMIETFSNDPSLTPKGKLGKTLAKAVKPVVIIFEACARSLSPKETAEFYEGRARCDVVLEKMKNPHELDMVKSFRVYAAMAALWKKFESMNGGEAIRFLRSEKIINDTYTDRELYQIFAKIKLPLASQGRPKLQIPENTVS